METFGFEVQVVEAIDSSLYMPCVYGEDEIVFIDCISAGDITPVFYTEVYFYRLREGRSFDPRFGFGALGHPVGPVHVMNKGIKIHHCEDEAGNQYSSSYCDDIGSNFDLKF